MIHFLGPAPPQNYDSHAGCCLGGVREVRIRTSFLVMLFKCPIIGNFLTCADAMEYLFMSNIFTIPRRFPNVGQLCDSTAYDYIE